MGGQSLERRLGPVDAAAIVIANVVGVGIFTTPAFVATIVPHPQALLAVWVCGGALAFAGSLAYGDLAAGRWPAVNTSERQNAIVVDDELRVSFGIDEFGVLATEIGFGAPTGLRAAASNVDSDAFLDRKLQE